jgi:hypothetical protein
MRYRFTTTKRNTTTNIIAPSRWHSHYHSLRTSHEHSFGTANLQQSGYALHTNTTQEFPSHLIMSSNAATSVIAAAEQVLNTTELLEHILFFLPMPQVLGKSRVSRDWKAVIDESPDLQKKLFLFQHDGRTEVISPQNWFPKPLGWSQTLGTEDLNLLFSMVNAPVYSTSLMLNPLVDWVNQGDLPVTHEMKVIHPKPFHPSLIGVEAILGKLNRAYVRRRFSGILPKPQEKSSWHNMYLTSPPITDIIFALPASVGHRRYHDDTQYHQISIHAEHGVTLGMLHERLEERMKMFRLQDVKSRVQKIEEKHRDGKHFVRNWGKKEFPIFLVQRNEDVTDLVPH